MERGELARYDRKAGAWLPFVGGMSAGALDFSRDGQWVVYVKHPEGTLWRSRIDGSDPLQLTFGPDTTDGPHWSPDGRQIAFRSSLPGQPKRIFLISADGGVPTELLPDNENKKEEGIPTWSHDGRFIAFGELRYDAKNIRIHVVELATGKVTPVPGSEGLWTPRWSPSGRYLLALKSGGALSNSPALLVFDFRTKQWRTLAERQVNEPVWSHDEKYIYFDVVQSRADDAIWRVRVAESLGPQRVSIPDLVGQTERAATLNLRQRGLDLATVSAVPLAGVAALRRSLPRWLRWTSAAGFVSTLFSLLISAYPFVNVVSARGYATKILVTIVLSNCLALGFYMLRTRSAALKAKTALSDAA